MKVYNIKIVFIVLFLSAFGLTFSAGAQTVKPQAEVSKTTLETYKLNSKLMAREMPYRVILPDGYGNPQTKNVTAKPLSYSVIYLLHGLTGHFNNWADKTKLTDYAKNYNYIIVMPEGGNGWYTDSSSVANDKYESYIVQELIPEIDKKYRTISDRQHRAVAGLSMGGYGSIKFGLKYPEMFSLVGSFSGALGAASFSEKNAGGIGKAIDLIFGATDSEKRQSNDVFKIVKEMTAEKIKNLPFIYLDCGTEDFLIQSNRDFAALLLEKKIPHEFRQLPGIHDWKFWNSQVNEFLEVSEKFIK